MNLHFLRTPESENQYFSGFVCVGMCLCASVTSVTKKQITAKTSSWYSTFVSHVDAISKFF